MAYDLKGVLRAIGGFDDHDFATFADVGDRAVDGLDALLGDLIDFHARFLRALLRIMGNHFGTLGDAMEGVFGAGSGRIGAVDGGLVHEMNGVFGTVFRFDDHGFGDGIQLGDGAVDGGDDILGSAHRQDQ